MSVLDAPAWAYGRGSEAEHFAGFCHDYLIQSVDEWDGLPLDLEPFQLRLMGEALAYGDDGWPIWNSVVIVMPRKNGKTQLLAALAVYRLVTADGSPEILLAASSDKQAGRLFDAAATYVRRHPELAALARVRDHVGEVIREDGGGRIVRMASDPGKLHGYNPSLVVCDELAQWTTPTLRRAYAALTSGGAARKAPQTFTITTAGEAQHRNDSILGRILDETLLKGELERSPGLTVGRLWPARTLVFNFEAPTTDPGDVPAMKLANPASWVTEEYLARQAENPELTDSDVLQLHGCVWAAGETMWLPTGAWEMCFARNHVPDGAEITLAFDGSYDNDATALVGCWNGHVFVVGCWERPERMPEGWKVPRAEVEATVARTMARYRVREFACDPPGWHREIEEWSERYGRTLTFMYPTNRRRLMAEACSKFYTAVTTGLLTHDGDKRLARHIANAVAKDTPEGIYITKEHPTSQSKIDLAVAAVVAYDRAIQAPAPRRRAVSWS